ncbi:MAG TPA: signal peptidase II [Thermoanaerobaculia bacterium]
MFRDGKKLDYLFLSLAILVLDQWTKWLVEVHLPHSASHPVLPGFLNLTHVKNTGVAFGLFASHGADGGAWLLVVMGIVALAAVFLYFRLAPARNRLLLYSLALIVGGALGNLIDRLASGAVTDFLDVYVGTYHWPAFNVADSAITVGIGLMILDSFRSHRKGETAAREEPPADSGRAAASEA